MPSNHFDAHGDARMVDVSGKAATIRTATAEAVVQMLPQTLQMIRQGQHAKGDVLGVARLAAIQAAKQTPQLIPLCHAIPLEAVDVRFEFSGPETLVCHVRTRTSAKTGVEMEALTAAAVAGLTVYDMCKAVDRSMQVGPIRLLEKTGGASGDFQAT